MFLRVILFLTIVFSLSANATVCGKPSSIEEVRSGSSIFKVTLSGYVEEGTNHFTNEHNGRVVSRPYRVLHFNVLSVIKGLPRNEIYVIYYLDKVFGNNIPNPPSEINAEYLLSFYSSKTDKGTLNEPFSSGPCELQQRI